MGGGTSHVWAAAANVAAERAPVHRAMTAAEVIEWALLARIDELEDELVEARKVSGPVPGGPPLEWDQWIIALPDNTFADLLEPKARRATVREVDWLELNAGRVGTYTR